MRIMMRCSLIFFIVFVAHPLAGHGINRERVEDGASVDSQNHQEYDHEVILGSKTAAEEFEDLPPEEAKKRLRGIAKLMDMNKNQYVEREELEEWILSSFESLAKEESLERFEDSDADGNGFVTWEEHAIESFGDASERPEYGAGGQNDTLLAKEEKELFEKADKDGNGKLDKEEYARLSHPYDFVEMHDLLVKHVVQRKDTDKDGQISLIEFLENLDGAESNPETKAVEKDRFEYELDKNKDGVLSEQEITSWIIPDNQHIADIEAEHLIDNSDDNKDQKLSIDEIVNHYDVFVGSEATDFGEHLIKYKDEL